MINLISRHNLFYYKIALLGIIVAVSMPLAYAWVSPTETPPNGNIGLRNYVSDCSDFANNGWSSKDQCLKDGRFHLVQQNYTGVTNDLREAIENGADIKVTFKNGNGFLVNRICQSSLIANSYAYCNEVLRYAGSIFDDIPSVDNNLYSFNAPDPKPHKVWAHLGATIIRSDGTQRSVSLDPRTNGVESYVFMSANGSPTYSASDLKWFVRY